MPIIVRQVYKQYSNPGLNEPLMAEVALVDFGQSSTFGQVSTYA